MHDNRIVFSGMTADEVINKLKRDLEDYFIPLGWIPTNFETSYYQDDKEQVFSGKIMSTSVPIKFFCFLFGVKDSLHEDHVNWYGMMKDRAIFKLNEYIKNDTILD